MNFLAHHIISILQDNIYYNIGLTLPDLLSLQNRNCKVTLSFCDNIIENLGIAKIAFFEEKEDKDTFTKDDAHLCLKGMKVHLLMDKWFHNDRLFFLLIKKINNIEKENYLPSHQLLEILLDLYIDRKIKDSAKSLQKTYANPALSFIIEFFKNFCSIDMEQTQKFIDFIKDGTFIGQYRNPENLIMLLRRISIKYSSKKIFDIDAADETDSGKEIDIKNTRFIENELRLLEKIKTEIEEDLSDMLSQILIVSQNIQKEILLADKF
ncbi:MAG: hypothetical protein KBG82_05620 [Spirochaetes bacterium]|nr:hypothetical protein [Spirochaetota bacterium]NLJ05854.1 hypothetical protein [Exilispira sp.]MBP8991439.1 hypothetical protein [Spirochaetota bacterium]HNV43240.1 hypothetical protein [Exilispira sp.]HOV46087.1 hypothetical protein [Exilispira sp.]